ncbi:MAG: hypothetical protein C4542_08145 [Dehalococcoidia bacterium]|nr:MAG: hypothetical protein C4542_08145 [Dehalococcoidia bacterium]
MSKLLAASSAGAVIQGIPTSQIPNSNKKTIWVDANFTQGRRDGSRLGPYATIDAAIAKAATGDTILIAAGHTENMSTAAIFAVDVAGLTIRGLGEGERRPTFTSTAAAGACMITVANTVLENLKFVANFATGTTQAIDLAAAADGTIIRNCAFRDTSAANEFLIHIDIATTIANVVIEGCDFTTAAGSMTSSIFFTGTSSNVVIRNNRWQVDASASVIDHLTDNPSLIRIHNNRIVNIDVTAGLVIGLKSDDAGTGIIYDNYIQSPSTGAAVLAATNDFHVAQNFCSNDINTSGVLNPAADTYAS